MVEPTKKDPIQTLRRLVPWTDQVKEITYLPGGYSNDNYFVSTTRGNYALRVCKRPGPSDSELQYLHLSIAPNVAEYDPVTGDMLTHWIEGELLAKSPFSVEEAVRYLKELHAKIPPNISKYNVIEKILTCVDSAAYVKEIIKKIGWSPLATGPSHNDLNPWNIIRSKNGFRTLDWEYAGDNDPLFDLVALCHGLEFDENKYVAVTNAFASNVTLSHLTRTRAIFLLREHAWAVDQINSGNVRAEIVEQRDNCLDQVLTLLQEL